MRALIVALLVVLPPVWWLAAQWAAVRVLRSTHVVYFLVDRAGVVLYVGSTNDIVRRFNEHVDEREPGEWRKAIYDIVPVRHCISRREARRIEERMIHALTDGARVRMCKPINNVALVKRPLLVSPARLIWLVAYRLNGCLWPAVRWHGPNLGRLPGGAGDDQRSPLHAGRRVVPARSSPVANPVSNADSPQWAPLGALEPADASAPVLTSATPPAQPEPAPRAALHLVASAEDEPGDDKLARRREQNRAAQQRKRDRAAAQKRAAE